LAKVRRGRLVVISGPSGSGKTTVCDRLLAEPDIARAVTATTRKPRPGERDGIDYFFYDEESFRRGIREGKFLEWAEVYGRLYGTPEEPLEAQLAAGRTVLLNIDVQGASELMRRGVDALTIFIEPPSVEELRRRLMARGADDAESIERRLETARAELAQKDRYDHCVVNADLDRTVEEILARIRAVPERT
jgi:guanylate kinase